MPFLTANIDRAIVMTQYDLRGFYHPFGIRLAKMSPKFLDALTGNFCSFAAHDKDKIPTIDSYADYFESSFEDYLAMCQQLAFDCDESEKETIQLIIQEIVRQSEEMKAEVAAGNRDSSPYLQPLEKDNRWGRTVLALAQAFEVNLKK